MVNVIIYLTSMGSIFEANRAVFYQTICMCARSQEIVQLSIVTNVHFLPFAVDYIITTIYIIIYVYYRSKYIYVRGTAPKLQHLPASSVLGHRFMRWSGGRRGLLGEVGASRAVKSMCHKQTAEYHRKTKNRKSKKKTTTKAMQYNRIAALGSWKEHLQVNIYIPTSSDDPERTRTNRKRTMEYIEIITGTTHSILHTPHERYKDTATSDSRHPTRKNMRKIQKYN